jgi:branched-chain amino acid transport system substrate-binding protein
VSFGYLNDELAFGFPAGVGPEVTAMGNAGVNYIATCIDQTSVLTLEQELHRQGMADVVVSLPQGYGDDEYLSANADLLEGDVLSLVYRPVEADIPEGSLIEAMVEYLDRAGQVNDYAIQGWIGAHLFVTGLLAAGPEFDRASVIEATNQITDYDAGGLLPQGVDWTTAHDAPGPDDPTGLLVLPAGRGRRAGAPGRPGRAPVLLGHAAGRVHRALHPRLTTS